MPAVSDSHLTLGRRRDYVVATSKWDYLPMARIMRANRAKSNPMNLWAA